MFTHKKREGMNAFACAVSRYVAETTKASIKDHKPLFPIIPLGIVAYGFAGQPFSKQPYTRAHVCTLMTRKSCAVGMRNAILRNYLILYQYIYF